MQNIVTTATFSHEKKQAALFGEATIRYQYWRTASGEVLLLNGHIQDTSREIYISYNPLQDMSNATCDIVNQPSLF
jgi:hypothetical protein